MVVNISIVNIKKKKIIIMLQINIFHSDQDSIWDDRIHNKFSTRVRHPLSTHGHSTSSGQRIQTRNLPEYLCFRH